MAEPMTLRDFCEPGDTYVNFATGERIIIPTPGKDNAMKYRITDTAIPDEEVVLEIEFDEEYDEPDEPEVTEEQAEQILDWWNDIPGRNYQVLEDGGYIICIHTDLDSGVPMIGVWSQETSDTTWPLSGFPFSSLNYEEVTQ